MNPSSRVLIVPYPYQGHVIPAMAVSHRLVKHGFSVTFVNTELSHERITSLLVDDHEMEGIQMVSIPDGLVGDEKFISVSKIANSLMSTVPAYLEELVRKANEKHERRIEWAIVDGTMGFVIPVAKKLGLKVVVLSPASATTLAMTMSIPKLVQNGIIDYNGLAVSDQNQQFEIGTLPVSTDELVWSCNFDSETQNAVFHLLSNNAKYFELAEFIMCNSFHELEQTTLDHFPQILPIGPLCADQNFNKPVGHFWKEDTSCLKWLDKHPKNSVIYVAFGSVTVFDKRQFEEIAFGLELCNRPFLWVVRPDLTSQIDKAELNDYKNRIEGRGLLVEWCSQQEVLGHSSIAFFLSHCGWNSTLEGVSNGVPFLCWPYFVDQTLNQTFICNVWRTGLKMDPENKEIVLRDEIKERIENLFGDYEGISARASKLKEVAHMSVAEGGSSYQNFKGIVETIRG